MSTTLIGAPEPEPDPAHITYGTTNTAATGTHVTFTYATRPTYVHQTPPPALPAEHDLAGHVCHEDCPGWTWET